MSELRYTFDPQKLGQALAYLAGRGVPDLTKMKASKLLFFADQMHLRRYGRPIIGDRYVCMVHGPVPSRSLDVMREAIRAAERHQTSDIAAFVRVNLHCRQPAFESATVDVFDRLSQAEQQILDEVASTLGPRTASQLRDLSHRDRGWSHTWDNRLTESDPIPYETFFDLNDPAQRAALDLAIEDQESDRLLESLG